jgi:hypothetical protein
VNLWGVIHGIRAFVPLLIKQAAGSRGQHRVVGRAQLAGINRPLQCHEAWSRHAIGDALPGSATQGVSGRRVLALSRLCAHGHRRVASQPSDVGRSGRRCACREAMRPRESLSKAASPRRSSRQPSSTPIGSFEPTSPEANESLRHISSLGGTLIQISQRCGRRPYIVLRLLRNMHRLRQ